MISAAIPLALSGAQAIFGGIQAHKGKKILDQTERPEYKIPDEILNNLSVSERMALQGLPDAQKKAYVDNLNQNLATSLRGLSSRKAGVAGVSRLSQSQNQAYKDLLSMDAEARNRNEQLAMAARKDLAGYKDKAFELNKYDPYQQKIAEGQALYGAGLQNIFGGVNTAGGISQMSMYDNGGGGNNGNDGGDYKSSPDNGSMDFNSLTPEQQSLLNDFYKRGTSNTIQKYAIGR